MPKICYVPTIFGGQRMKTKEPKNSYHEFLSVKAKCFTSTGFSVSGVEINKNLKDWQREIVLWSLRKGRSAMFAGCGLGKTLVQLEWAAHVHKFTDKDVMVVAPLAVAEQTHLIESPKFGMKTTLCRSMSDVRGGINITNYEMLQHFDPKRFAGVVLDESSILKSMSGATKTALIDMFRDTPYRMCCTATPAPNDYMELGNHAEFLGVMTRVEMLSMFFVHDGGDTGQWRLKGHAKKDFWKWVCSWAVVIRAPSDIGYSDKGYVLLPMRREQITVSSKSSAKKGRLLAIEASTLRERNGARRSSIDERVSACADKVNADRDQWIVWCGLNDESAALAAAIPGSVEVSGSDTPAHKIKAMRDFVSGKTRVVVTKLSIWGFGLNLQNCHKWFHVGISDSFEQMYQGDRRCWRFGQEHECECYVVTSDLEGAVVRNIDRKERDFDSMNKEIVGYMRDEMNKEVRGATLTVDKFETDAKKGKNWTAVLGDCVEEMAKMDTASVHYSIFSPPFASLYTYSALERDMGNTDGVPQFLDHFGYAVKELRRVVMPGRLVSFHCMNMLTSKTRDGFIGIRDFRGELIRAFEAHGFIFHSEVVIWKDPLIAASRTHALGLAHKQIVKDSAMCRQGLPDYLVTMRVPGDNPEPVKRKRGFERYLGADKPPNRRKTDEARTNKFSHEVWQRYASPVWMDINPGDTLQRESAREERDERHICPLQLGVIRRAIELWTNPGDLVLSPFMGIASEGYVALQENRTFIGIELKRSYWEQGYKNLANVRKRTKLV